MVGVGAAVVETLEVDDIIMVEDGCIPADIASAIRLCLFVDTPVKVCFDKEESASLLLCKAQTILT